MREGTSEFRLLELITMNRPGGNDVGNKKPRPIGRGFCDFRVILSAEPLTRRHH